MCGRYELSLPVDELLRRFRATLDGPYSPRYNIAPASFNPVLRDPVQRRMELFRWGMLPSWWSHPGRSLINVRVESLRDKPTFRRHLLERRLLIPAVSFFEWKKGRDGKVPFRISLKDTRPFAFAGIWEIDKDQRGQNVRTYSIITGPANDLVGDIHDRMPAILQKEDEDDWLDPKTDPDALFRMLEPFPAEKMDAYPVGSAVNSPRNDSPDIVRPLV